MGRYVSNGRPPSRYKPGYVPTADHKAAVREAAQHRANTGYRAVIARGVRYNNITQAARALNMSPRSMRSYIDSDKPHHREYQFAPE